MILLRISFGEFIINGGDVYYKPDHGIYYKRIGWFI